ncbi:MAG: CdaR family protein [Ignavibacteria bacterium]|nr:CdaR family protein [Ignavibacteria bacterium]
MKRNIIIIIISFIFALAIWLYISLSDNYIVNLSIPIDLKLSQKQALASELPNTIEISLKGKGWDLLTVMLGHKPVYILDLSNYKRNIKISPLSDLKNIIGIPEHITVLNVYPDTLDIIFDNITEKYLKVKNNLIVVPKEGYIIVGNPRIEPDSVKVYGASSIIMKLKSIPTVSLTIENVSQKFTRVVNLKDTLTNLIQIEPKTVTISYNIELLAERKLEGIDVFVTNLPSDKEVVIIPPKIDLIFRGGVNQLSKLSNDDVNVSIDFKVLEKDTTGFITPDIRIPIDYNLIKYEPSQFQYIIKNKSEQ